jgi:hypothetical protein
MGLDVNGVRSLLYSKKVGIDFSRTAMIGRQMYFLSPSEFESALESFGYQLNSHDIHQLLTKSDNYIEPMLSLLGAKLIHSFDCTGYEGATHVHDMNCAIPESMKGQYSLVIDSGTLEHVFNYPIAIKNCMEMLDVNGTCVLITPANNFCGHGFYQFSPELFFNIFGSINGFQIQDIIAFEDKPFAPWFSVSSPMAARQRVMLQSGRPIYLLVIAKKFATVDIFKATPQQSDYVTAWDRWQENDKIQLAESSQNQNASSSLRSPARHSPSIPSPLKRLTPNGLKKATRDVVRFMNSYVFNPFNPEFFTPIDPTSDR